LRNAAIGISISPRTSSSSGGSAACNRGGT